MYYESVLVVMIDNLAGVTISSTRMETAYLYTATMYFDDRVRSSCLLPWMVVWKPLRRRVPKSHASMRGEFWGRGLL